MGKTLGEACKRLDAVADLVDTHPEVKAGETWSGEAVRSRLKETMENEVEKVWKIKEDNSISPRMAAYLHGLRRLCAAISAKGLETHFAW